MNPPAEDTIAVILAGGFGTRIQRLLPDLPKPMAPVNGKPFVEWVVRYLARQGINHVILSTGYLAEKVAGYFERQPVPGVSVECVAETEPLGTAGGFLNAIKHTRVSPENWLILNGDSLALAPLAPLRRLLDEPETKGALLGVPMADASRYGTIDRDSTGDLVGFREKQPGAGTINAGVYLFRASTVRVFPWRAPLSFEREIFPALASRGCRLKVCVTPAPFLDIGTPESLPLAEAFIREHPDQFR